MENLNNLNINIIPLSAKEKHNNIPFGQIKNISKTRSHCKSKVSKDKLSENRNNNIKCKIPTDELNKNYIEYEKEKKIQIYNFPNSDTQKEKSIIKDKYNDPSYFKDEKEPNITIKQYNIENSNINNDINEKRLLSAKSKNNKKILSIPYQNFQNSINYLKKTKKKVKGNLSSNIICNNSLKIIKNNNTNFGVKNNSKIFPNENAKMIEIKNNNNTTSKIGGKTKKIFSTDNINIIQNINTEYNPNKKNPIKLTKNSYIKAHNNENIKMPENHLEENQTKKNSSFVKNIFIKKNTNYINKNRNGLYSENFFKNNFCNFNSNNNNLIYIDDSKKTNIINNNKIKETKINHTQFYENEKLNNVIPNEINAFKFQEEVQSNNGNNSIFKQYNNLNKELNIKTSGQNHKKNYSYDLSSNRNIFTKKTNNNNNGNLFIINKLKSNIKDLLFNNNKEKTVFSEEKETEKDEILYNIKKEEEKEKEKEETIIDESIIFNDSNVYGTFTIKQTITNTIPKNTEEKDNKNINDNNKDKINIYDNEKEKLELNSDDKNKNQTIKENINEKINLENEKKEKEKEIKISNNKKEVSNDDNKNVNQYFKSCHAQSNAGKNYGATKTNQDMPVKSLNLNGIPGFNIFGVLDGHGTNGHYVSQFLSEYLVKNIKNNYEVRKKKDLDEIYKILKKSDYEILMNIFLDSDRIIGEQDFDVSFSGTTCVLVIQLGQKLICANVGDSRAILIYDKENDVNLRHTRIFELSHDCKPDLPEEKQRILDMGGTVDQMLDINGVKGGPQRVWIKNKNYPGLAMSRSLGDYKGKECGIIPLPEIIEYDLNEKSKYMVICSDGVWEFLSNKNVMEIGNNYYLSNDITGFTQKLIKVSEEWWEENDVVVDDITVVAVFF